MGPKGIMHIDLRRALRRLRRRSGDLEALMEQGLRADVGLRRQSWLMTERPVLPATLHALAQAVGDWCAQEMAETRRPYGIDHMAVGVACALPGGAPIASVSLGLFRPLEFYQEGGTRDRLEEFVRGLPLTQINEQSTPVRLAAALFSWGDLARATIFRDEPA